MTVRVRFAPSPTGNLHFGNLRAALFNWLFARHENGKFLLRLEDTDLARSTPEAIQNVYASLKWANLDWDEEPIFQTHKIKAHQAAVEKMLAAGHAYRATPVSAWAEPAAQAAAAEVLPAFAQFLTEFRADIDTRFARHKEHFEAREAEKKPSKRRDYRAPLALGPTSAAPDAAATPAVFFRMPFHIAGSKYAVDSDEEVLLQVHPNWPVLVHWNGIEYVQRQERHVGDEPYETLAFDVQQRSLAGFPTLELLDRDGKVLYTLAGDLPAVEQGALRVLNGVYTLKSKRRFAQFKDLIKGVLKKPFDSLKNRLILRSDGTPVFHLANVVDDIDSNITHILRGDDHVENSYWHPFLFEALGVKPPQYGHLPMIVNAEGKPYSKRDGDVDVASFRDTGVLPEAFVNYLALLGWSPGDNREKMSREEIIAAFTLERIGDTAAQFDPAKLANLNGQYLRELPVEDLVERVKPFMVKALGERMVRDIYKRVLGEKVRKVEEIVAEALITGSNQHLQEIDFEALMSQLAKAKDSSIETAIHDPHLQTYITGLGTAAVTALDPVWLNAFVTIEQERLTRLSDIITDKSKYYFAGYWRPDVSMPRVRELYESPSTLSIVDTVLTSIKHIGPFYIGEGGANLDEVAQRCEDCIKASALSLGMQMKEVGPVVRLALTGGFVSPPLGILCALLGSDRVVERLSNAMGLCYLLPGQTLIKKAKTAFLQDKFSEAIQFLTLVTDKVPNVPVFADLRATAFYELAQIHWALNQIDAVLHATTALIRLLEGSSSSYLAMALSMRAMVYFGQCTSQDISKIHLAESDLTAVIKLNRFPKGLVDNALLMRAHLAALQGNLDSSIEDYSTLITGIEFPAASKASARVGRSKSYLERSRKQKLSADKVNDLALALSDAKDAQLNPLDISVTVKLASNYLCGQCIMETFSLQNSTEILLEAVGYFSAILSSWECPIQLRILALQQRGVTYAHLCKWVDAKRDFYTVCMERTVSIEIRDSAILSLAAVMVNENSLELKYDQNTCISAIQFSSAFMKKVGINNWMQSPDAIPNPNAFSRNDADKLTSYILTNIHAELKNFRSAETPMPSSNQASLGTATLHPKNEMQLPDLSSYASAGVLDFSGYRQIYVPRTAA